MLYLFYVRRIYFAIEITKRWDFLCDFNLQALGRSVERDTF